jgi:hypothetical protein
MPETHIPKLDDHEEAPAAAAPTGVIEEMK